MQMNMCLFQLNKAILGPAGIAVRSCPWTLAAAHRSRCFSLNLVKAGAEGCPEFRSPYTEFVLSGNLCVNRIRRTLASHWLYKVVRIGNLALDSIKYYLLWWSTLVGWCWWIHNTEQNYLVYLVYLVCLPGFCSSRKMISCQLGLKTRSARVISPLGFNTAITMPWAFSVPLGDSDDLIPWQSISLDLCMVYCQYWFLKSWIPWVSRGDGAGSDRRSWRADAPGRQCQAPWKVNFRVSPWTCLCCICDHW